MKQQENDFEALRKLLALKRHEVPPPGYFNGFSSEVVARIRTGDVGTPESFANRLLNEAPWLFRIFNIFQDKPAYAGIVASFLCLLLVAGIVYTDNSSSPQMELPMSPQATADGDASVASAASPATASGFLTPSESQGLSVFSTNPVLSLEASGGSFGSANSLFKPADFH